jgi:hypothetical protein
MKLLVSRSVRFDAGADAVARYFAVVDGLATTARIRATDK